MCSETQDSAVFTFVGRGSVIYLNVSVQYSPDVCELILCLEIGTCEKECTLKGKFYTLRLLSSFSRSSRYSEVIFTSQLQCCMTTLSSFHTKQLGLSHQPSVLQLVQVYWTQF